MLKWLKRLFTKFQDNYNSPTFHYGTKVKLIDNFYKGQEGIIIQYLETGVLCSDPLHNHLKIKLNDNNIIIVPTCDVEIIN